MVTQRVLAAMVLLVAGGAVLLVGWRHGLRSRHVPTAVSDSAEVSSLPASGGLFDNPGLRSLLAARSAHTHPERFSPLIAPRPFDKTGYDSNPQAYLDVIEPGRCFQTANTSGHDGIPQLRAVSSPIPHAMAGDTVVLVVKGEAFGPITFTAFDGGVFAENGLGSVTVRADIHGYAPVHFTAPSNARGHLAVLAGSPLAVGTERFFVDLTPAVAAGQL
jgi:hypothetical protein